MKSARFFFASLSVAILFFFVSAVNISANSTSLGNVNNTGAGYFFNPTPASQGVALYGTPTLNSTKTTVLVNNDAYTNITRLLIGQPRVVSATGQELYAGDSGAVGFLSGQIAVITGTPAISGGDYVAYTLQKLKVPGVGPAYAAAPTGIGGVGYRSLFPVLQLWSLVRNIAYLFFAIIFVVVGLMIMLGRKLDPKTTLTIQAALPKIIISLVLVTFSYAIAGFVIDLMYVVIALIFSVLGPLLEGNPTGDGKALYESIRNGEILFAFFFRTPWVGAGAGLVNATSQLGDQFIQGITFGALDNVVGHVIGQTGGGVVGILMSLILAIAVFYALFKIWLKLVMTYIQIILAVVAGPFLIMMDAIPKPNQSNFMNWIKGLLGNAMIYPMTILLLLVGMIISAGVGKTGVGNESFIAPLTGIGNAGVAQVIIGLGMLLSIPAILEKVPGWFGANAKGGLAELSNSWQEPLQNNWAARSYAANKKAEDDVKGKLQGKKIAARLESRYGPQDVKPPQIAASQQSMDRYADFTRMGATAADNFAMKSFLRDKGMGGFDSSGRFSMNDKAWSGITDTQKRHMINEARQKAGLANANDLVEIERDLAALREITAANAAWAEYGKDVAAKEAYTNSLRGRVDSALASADAGIGRLPGAGILTTVASSLGGGKK